MRPPILRYTSIPNLSDDDVASEGEEKPRDTVPDSGITWHGSGKIRLIPILLIGINILLSVFSAVSLYRAQKLWHCEKSGSSGDYRRPDLNADLKINSAFCKAPTISPIFKLQTDLEAPILDALDFNPTLKTFNGKLRDNSSIWRQPPSEEVDRAWDYISTEGLEVVTVSSSALEKSGKDPAKCIKAPPSWGEGQDAYIAQIDVFHQIHCLDELRKEVYYDHYYKYPPDELHRVHKSHCIHMLLQNIMCAADVGVVSHNWVHNEHISDPKTRPMPDFDLVKKCRDFDAILDWVREKSVKDLSGKWQQLRYTPGMDIVPGDGYA